MAGDGLLIRDVRQEDVDAVVAIAAAAWRSIFAWYRETLGEELSELVHPDPEADKERQVRRACRAEGGARVCVAELDGQVVGFITIWFDRGSGIGEIGNNAVHPDYQRRGIGPRMYQHAFALMREEGMRYCKVGTGGDPSHAPARHAYQKAGFTIAVPSVTYYRKL